MSVSPARRKMCMRGAGPVRAEANADQVVTRVSIGHPATALYELPPSLTGPEDEWDE
ncbi:hypothetical protein SAMN05444166_3805 [Singulisphaera sp. GP187]|uniref:hypothetical protein n=1 Tax=Singulisphaera sp. GP187 TaxID=1882752 RepID=UPI00092C0D6D|nr:hypothetical protein [Singulisphaera sp. GP187]SIO32640.1 hypothetical protein SAMN05444166_3805 [Singulisphaera sp. GP187]